MAKGKDRLEVASFLDFPETMTIWQLLDRSPQIRAQLARAMASSNPTKRGTRPAMAARLDAAAADGPPQVETHAKDHDENDIICLYITAWIGSKAITKTLIDSGSVVELINRKHVDRLGLIVHTMDEIWIMDSVASG